MGSRAGKVIDIHFHVGLLGDRWPRFGGFSEFFQDQLAFKVFLAYARLKAPVDDHALREATERIIDGSNIDHVVCLALDAVYDGSHNRREDLSHMWVDNQYVVELRRALGEKVLFGASVHPYDLAFVDRVKACVDDGAVLLKWLPSAQRIDLAEPQALAAMKRLARLGAGGRPLPLLLHVGGEYAIPPADERLKTFDFHSWSRCDDVVNRLRGRRRWETPRVAEVAGNIEEAAREGAVIIFAHCGLPYFFSGRLRSLFEHSDFGVVRRYLEDGSPDRTGPRRFYADVSACCTPFRKPFFPKLRALPEESLLFGSDCPTPVFELSAGRAEHVADFKAALAGGLSRLVVPQDNLIDVSYRELYREFPAHKMFTNFGDLA